MRNKYLMPVLIAILIFGIDFVVNASKPLIHKTDLSIQLVGKEGELVVCLASKGDFSQLPGTKEGLEGLATLAHKYGYPVTYYLKPVTVEASQAELKEWHQKYGDEVGWFSEATPFEKASAELAKMKSLVTWHSIKSTGNIKYGPEWINFYQKNGIESVWGRCYEQTATDGITDRGCPPGFYYAKPDCFKAPNTGKGGIISVPWLSNDLNLVFRTAQQSTFTFDPNDSQDIGISTSTDDSFWTAELNEYKKQTSYNKIVPLVIQQEIGEFAFSINDSRRIAWRRSGSDILENLFKILKKESIKVVTVSQAVDIYKAAYPQSTPPTYAIFDNISNTPVIRNSKSLQPVNERFSTDKKGEFKCFGPTFNGYYATGRIGKTWYYFNPKGTPLTDFGKNFTYFDKNGLLVFEEGNSTPIRITPYSNLPENSYAEAILPEMSYWYNTEKYIPVADIATKNTARGIEITIKAESKNNVIFSGDNMPYGVMLWGDYSAFELKRKAPEGTQILGKEGLFVPFILKQGINEINLIINKLKIIK